MQPRTPEIRGFGGEDRHSPFPPSNVSPDALNCDYSRGAIRKRKGYTRLHSNRLSSGGVEINAQVSSKPCIYIPYAPAYSRSGNSWSMSLVVEPRKLQPSYNYLVTDSGFTFSILQDITTGVRSWQLTLNTVDGGIPSSTNIDNPAGCEYRTKYAVEFGYNIATGKGFLTVNGSKVELDVTGTVDGGTTIFIGNQNPPVNISGKKYIVDEFRFWMAVKTDQQYGDMRWRELTQAEIDDATLVAYYKMDDVDRGGGYVYDSSGTANNAYFIPGDAPFKHPSLIVGSSDSDGGRALNGYDQHMFIPYHADWESLWTGYEFAIQFWASLKRLAQGPVIQLGVFNISSDLLCMVQVISGYQLRVKFERDGIAEQTLDTGYFCSLDKPFSVTCSYSRNLMTVTVWDEDGKTVATKDVGADCVGPALPAGPPATFGIYLGCNYSTGIANRMPLAFDEVRLWKRSLGSTEVDSWYNRELVDYTDGDLLGYWKLNGSDYKKDETNRSDIDPASSSTVPKWTYGLVNPVGGDRITMLAHMPTPAGPSDVLAATASDYYSVSSGAASHIRRWGAPDDSARSYCKYKGTVVIAGRSLSPAKYDGIVAPRTLTPPLPDLSGASAAAATGPGLTGVFKYRVQYIASHDDARGPISYSDVSVTLSNQKADITDIPPSYDTQVDTIRIYRTKAGGTAFYRLTDIANPVLGSGNASLLGDATADSELVELADEYLGVPDRSVVVFSHEDRVFLGNQIGQESRVIYSEPGYYERFAPDNWLYAGRGDGDEITGGISLGSRALLTKRHSLWLLQSGPYRATKLWEGCGCISHNTLSVGGSGVYFLSASGVMMWTDGSIPVKVGGNSQKPIWDLLEESKWATACGVYYPSTMEYWVSFNTSTGERITMVWSETSQAWAKLDLPVDAYCVASLDGGGQSLIGAIEGYVVELRKGENDGVDVNDSNYTLTGAVTAGAAQYIDVDVTLPTSGSGIAGVKVWVYDASGNRQQRIAYHNTSSRIYVDAPWSTTPDNTYTFVLGGFDWRWKSTRLHFGDGVPSTSLCAVRILSTIHGQQPTVAIRHWGDGVEGKAQSSVLSYNKRWADVPIQNNGHETEIQFSNSQPDRPVEIESFSLEYEVVE